MANISKNIKRLRTAKKLTQEQLAMQLNVTRQTISSWENDRTQPDIDMLAALSAALDADIEDLIYGKKKHVGLEADPGDKRKTLSLVLVIMGSLLFAVGLIFLFIYFWEKLPGLMKTALSFLPLLAGAGFGLFTVLTKKESVPFRESAAVLWYAGVISTFALINSLFSVDFGFANLLLADVILLLPVPFLLDSIFAFTAQTALSLLLTVRPMFDDGVTWYFFAGLAAFGVGCIYVFKNGQPKAAKQYCAWLGLLGVGAAAFAGCWTFTVNTVQMVIAVTFLFFTALYIAGRGRRFGLQLRIPAAAVLIAALPGLTAAAFIDDLVLFFDLSVWEYLFLAVWAAACLFFAFRARKADEQKNDRLQTAFTALFLFYCAVLLIAGVPKAITLLVSLAAGVLTVMTGVRRGKLPICNLGMLELAANVFILLIEIRAINLFLMGLLFVVIGVVFLVVNKVMIKKFEARKAAMAAIQAEQAETEGTENA